MFRRVFLRRLFHGLGFVAAADLVLDDAPKAAAPPPAVPVTGRQRSKHVTLYRYAPGPAPYARIDWFEQKPGDTVCAVWTDGTAEAWEVTTAPHWADNEYGRVECVGCRQVCDRRPLPPYAPAYMALAAR